MGYRVAEIIHDDEIGVDEKAIKKGNDWYAPSNRTNYNSILEYQAFDDAKAKANELQKTSTEMFRDRKGTETFVFVMDDKDKIIYPREIPKQFRKLELKLKFKPQERE